MVTLTAPREFIKQVQGKRGRISVEVTNRPMVEALQELELPEGWIKVPTEASVMYRTLEKALPSVKVYYSSLRVDVDIGKGYKVRSTVESFDNIRALVGYVQTQLNELRS